jgi:hypothetical protein
LQTIANDSVDQFVFSKLLLGNVFSLQRKIILSCQDQAIDSPEFVESDQENTQVEHQMAVASKNVISNGACRASCIIQF